MADALRYTSGHKSIWSWLCAALWLLPAWGCSSTHGPSGSTETGNPPVIDLLRVALKVTAAAVLISGDKGAVSPGGATIEITNLSTGAVTNTTADPDGSFEAAVDGSANDAFVVRASAGGATSKAVYVVRGGAVVSTGQDDSLSCEQRDQLAGAQLDLVAANADKHCLIDSDCKLVNTTASCHDRCGYALLSYAGEQEIAATSAAIDTGLCSRFAADGCKNLILPCIPPPTALCSAGQCVGADAGPALACEERTRHAGEQLTQAINSADRSCKSAADCVSAPVASVCYDACLVGRVSQAGKATIEAAADSIDRGVCGNFLADGCQRLTWDCPGVSDGPLACVDGQCMFDTGNTTPDCTTCLTETIEWGDNGGLVAHRDSSTLEPCAHYTHRRQTFDGTQPLMVCEHDFVACNSVTSTGAVLTALGHADVRDALSQSQVLYGVDQRPSDGSLFEIKIGGRVIDVSPASCEGAPPNCIPVPAGVQSLVELLRSIDTAELSSVASCKPFLGN